MKRKTRIERVYNEDTGWFETREVELNSYSLGNCYKYKTKTSDFFII